MLDMLTIGDGMITMNPKSRGPLRFVHEFERKIGGAELNTLIGCARLGLQTGWISRLGNDEFGRYLFNKVRGEEVDMTQVQLVDGYPTSVNFKEILETGGGRTFYYRQDSPTSTLTPESLSPEMFKQTRLLHITGVFPAIAPKNIDIIRRAIHLARKQAPSFHWIPTSV